MILQPDKPIKSASSKPLSKRGSFQFRNKLEQYFSLTQLDRVMLAYDFSKYGHHKQFRDDGTRYFNHPRSVAQMIVHELKVIDEQSVLVALLHDILEDSFLLSFDRIRKFFGENVAASVNWVTKSKKCKGGLFFKRLHNTRNWRSVLVKIADRIHNLRTLYNCPLEKITKQIKETRKYYFDLCDLLENIIPSKHRHCALYTREQLEYLCSHYENSSNPPKIKRGQII